jgi:hypothetical protein
MLDSETIAQQNSLRETYRCTLTHLLQHAAQYGVKSLHQPAWAKGSL